MPEFTRSVHIGLTVRDMRQSAEWYMRVLGFQFVREFTEEDPGGAPRILLLHPTSGFRIGVYQHPDCSGDKFDYRRTGLDHMAFEVAAESDLVAWMSRFDDLGVEHSPKRDIGQSAFVSFEDPDGVQYEMWFTRTPYAASSPA